MATATDALDAIEQQLESGDFELVDAMRRLDAIYWSAMEWQPTSAKQTGLVTCPACQHEHEVAVQWAPDRPNALKATELMMKARGMFPKEAAPQVNVLLNLTPAQQRSTLNDLRLYLEEQQETKQREARRLIE
jgi:hypothetical protein